MLYWCSSCVKAPREQLRDLSRCAARSLSAGARCPARRGLIWHAASHEQRLHRRQPAFQPIVRQHTLFHLSRLSTLSFISLASWSTFSSTLAYMYTLFGSLISRFMTLIVFNVFTFWPCK